MHYTFWFTYKVLHMIFVVDYYICILKMISGELGHLLTSETSPGAAEWKVGLRTPSPVLLHLPRVGYNWKGWSSEPNV